MVIFLLGYHGIWRKGLARPIHLAKPATTLSPHPSPSRMLKSSFWPWDWSETPISLEATSAETVHWICRWFDFVKLRQCLNLGDELRRVAYKRDGLVHTAGVTDKSALSCRIVKEVNPESTTQMFAPILRIRAWPSASISKMSTSARAWRCYLDPSFLSSGKGLDVASQGCLPSG